MAIIMTVSIDQSSLWTFLNKTPSDTARHGTARHGTARHDTTRHDTTRHDTTRHDTTRHDTTRHDTTRHDTTRHDTTRHDTLAVRTRGLCTDFVSRPPSLGDIVPGTVWSPRGKTDAYRACKCVTIHGERLELIWGLVTRIIFDG